MADNIITVYLENEDSSRTGLEGPTDMGLSLMELLKANEYDVLATCGGMALCGTCRVDILEGEEHLPEIGDDEYAMLDSLPDSNPNSRLACQLRLNDALDNLKFKLNPGE